MNYILPANYRLTFVLFLHPHIKDLLTFHILRFHLEAIFEAGDHLRELFVTVGARVEAWVELIERVAHPCERSPAVLSHCHFEGLTEHGSWVCVFFPVFGFRGFSGVGLFLLRGFLLCREVLGVDEYIAGVDERFRRLLFADTHHEDARLTDACRQPRVIRIGRDETEPVHYGGVHDVHRVDDHGAVGGVLADGVAELLNGLERVEVQRLFPRVHAVRRPVAVDAADGDLSVPTRFHEHLGKQGRLRVVAVNEDGDFISKSV